MVADEFMRLIFFFYSFFLFLYCRAIGGVWEVGIFAGEVFLGEVR